MAFSIDVSPKDLKFEFQDSCNCSCCCWGKTTIVPPDAAIYINTKGLIELWNPTKAKDSVVAAERCVSNLNKHLKVMASKVGKEYEVFREEVLREARVPIRDGHLARIQLKHVDSLNHVMARVASTSKSPITPTSD